MTAEKVTGKESKNGSGATERKQVTAPEIAAALGLNLRTVTDWFKAGKLPGRKIGRTGWTTTPAAFEAYMASYPDLSRYDLTSAQIADELGISDEHTVRRWFRDEGLPGDLVRGIGERGATWRTTRAQFDRWYAAYLEGRPAPTEPAGRDLTMAVTDTLATSEALA
jgi:hypothetical protein